MSAILELVDSRNNVLHPTSAPNVPPDALYLKLVIEFVLDRTRYMGGYYYYPIATRAVAWDQYDGAVEDAEKALNKLYPNEVTKFNCKGGALRKACELWK